MKKFILVLSIISVFSLLIFINHTLDKRIATKQTSSKPCIPTFEDGDGPYYQQNSPFRKKLVPEGSKEPRMTVRGKVLKADCKTPLSDIVLDIWQADNTGKYQQEWFRGRIKSDKQGNYEFETIMPKGYGEGTGYRPPHIHFKVWQDNNLLITSEMFFPEVKRKPGFDDAFIVTLGETNFLGKKKLIATHNIIVP